MSRVLPILFNTEMVQAILDDRKTVTRRICKDGDDYTVPDMSFYDPDKRTYAVHNYANKEHTEKLSLIERPCPICPGDILYVRETFSQMSYGYEYKADGKEIDHLGNKIKWRPSIHMPKEAARIFLRVTDVRVERLKDIDWMGAKEEGVGEKCIGLSACGGECKSCPANMDNYLLCFEKLWDSTIKKSDLDMYGWDANPYTWVIEFERCEKPDGEV